MVNRVRLLWALVIVATLPCAAPCAAADDGAVLESFKGVVKNLPAVLRVEQQVVKGEHGYTLQRIEAIDMAFDVRRTDSLVSPYLGDVSFILRWHYFTPCSPEASAALQKWMREGGIPPDVDCPPAPATPEMAREREPNTWEDRRAVARYAFQGDRWVPKEIETRRATPDARGGAKEIVDVFGPEQLSGWPLLDSALEKFFEKKTPNPEHGPDSL